MPQKIHFVYLIIIKCVEGTQIPFKNISGIFRNSFELETMQTGNKIIKVILLPVYKNKISESYSFTSLTATPM